MKKVLSVGCLWLALTGQALGQPEQGALDKAHAYLNALRKQAGLSPFKQNKILEQAARQHADYLNLNEQKVTGAAIIDAHAEQVGRPGYTGSTPAERAGYAGYPHDQVTENVSAGYTDSRASMDGLMGGIYHRFGFLDFESDEVGIGVAGSADRDRHTYYVYVMGNSALGQLCEQTPKEALAVAPFNCKGRQLDPDYMEKLCADPPPQALYRPPYPYACGNDTRLNAEYMDRFCADPPPQAIQTGSGRYYVLCPQKIRVAADWFERFCAHPPPGAAYRHSGKYVELCSRNIQVFSEWLDSFCAAPPPEAIYAYSGNYVLLCQDQRKVRTEYLEKVKDGWARQNPAVVLWPPRDAMDTPPVFYEEEPDPLPDRSVSGYPVSIQFNPAFRDIAVESFKLYRSAGQPPAGRSTPSPWLEVRETRLLTRSSDPNEQFSGHQFALFPLARLDWNTAYKAVVEAVVDGERKVIDWVFRTRNPGLPMYVIQGGGEVLPIKPGVRYALYLPPAPAAPDTVSAYQGRASDRVQIDVQTIDPNTLGLRVDGPPCETVDFTLPGYKRFQARLAVTDNTQTPHPLKELYAPCPEFAADFKIAGNGDVLSVGPDRKAMAVYVRGQPIGSIHWRSSPGMELKVEPWDTNAIKIQLTGVKAGQRATFTISNGRTFTVEVR